MFYHRTKRTRRIDVVNWVFVFTLKSVTSLFAPTNSSGNSIFKPLQQQLFVSGSIFWHIFDVNLRNHNSFPALSKFDLINVCTPKACWRTIRMRVLKHTMTQLIGKQEFVNSPSIKRAYMRSLGYGHHYVADLSSGLGTIRFVTEVEKQNRCPVGQSAIPGNLKPLTREKHHWWRHIYIMCISGSWNCRWHGYDVFLLTAQHAYFRPAHRSRIAWVKAKLLYCFICAFQWGRQSQVGRLGSLLKYKPNRFSRPRANTLPRNWDYKNLF